MWWFINLLKTLFLICNLNFIIEAKTLQRVKRKQFSTLHKWTSDLPMTFPTEQYLNIALKSGHYERDKPLPVDVDIEYGDDGYHRTFLTIPRLSNGVPYSLAVIAHDDATTVLNPRLMPYPNYEWHKSHGLNCTGITSAIKTFIDDCWRLWVVDSGQINSLQFCVPQLLAFDLVTDQLVHRYTFPLHLYTPGVSVFTALVVNVDEIENDNTIWQCGNTMVYIADPWSYGLIVYDVQTNNSWRIENALMHADENLQRLNMAADGIFTVSISPKEVLEGKKERYLYFHALNSYREIGIPLHFVNNASLWQSVNSSTTALTEFRIIGNRGIQCESEAIDRAGNLYCSLISSNALIAWKQGTAYNSDTLQVVAYNPDQLKYVTGLKVNHNAADEDEIWALSNDPTLFIGNTLKQLRDVVKFQIIGCRAQNLLENEACTVQATSIKRK